MNQAKYIGMDVHQSTTVVAVLNSDGRVVWKTIVATQGVSLDNPFHRTAYPLGRTFMSPVRKSWTCSGSARLKVYRPTSRRARPAGNLESRWLHAARYLLATRQAISLVSSRLRATRTHVTMPSSPSR